MLQIDAIYGNQEPRQVVDSAHPRTRAEAIL
jgi:hypothetical protein